MTETILTETKHLREKLLEYKNRIQKLENAQQAAINDCIVYMNMINDYGSQTKDFEDLKKQLILQFNSIKLPLERVLK